MHLFQRELIKRLVINNHQKFADLTVGFSLSDNIVFHIKQLIKKGLIRKREGLYHLTRKGLAYSSEMDLEKVQQESQEIIRKAKAEADRTAKDSKEKAAKIRHDAADKVANIAERIVNIITGASEA